VTGGSGSELRLRGITRRALELLDEQVRARPLTRVAARTGALERLTVPPLALDLGRMPDEGIALRLAGALYGALRSGSEGRSPGTHATRSPTPRTGR
jgi:hypothetical protein